MVFFDDSVLDVCVEVLRIGMFSTSMLFRSYECGLRGFEGGESHLSRRYKLQWPERGLHVWDVRF